MISVDSLREARIVLKTLLALSGHLDVNAARVQQCTPDGSWREWTDAAHRRLHELDDEDPLFTPPSHEFRIFH